MGFHQPPPFTANSTSFQDVPGSQIDQAVEAGIPGRQAWRSIAWQIMEVGKLGSLRFQVLASLDGVNWDLLAGIVANPTEGEVNEGDLGPGGRIEFVLTDTADSYLMVYRYYKVQAASPAGDPTRYGVCQLHIYAR